MFNLFNKDKEVDSLEIYADVYRKLQDAGFTRAEFDDTELCLVLRPEGYEHQPTNVDIEFSPITTRPNGKLFKNVLQNQDGEHIVRLYMNKHQTLKLVKNLTDAGARARVGDGPDIVKIHLADVGHLKSALTKLGS